MSHDVFISYSTKDKDIAEAICKSLERDGIRCWIAARDIQPGMESAKAITEAINTCRVFLVILSSESNTSQQVRREVERAIRKDLTILNFRIDNAILSKTMDHYLAGRHWLDASQGVFSKQLHVLSAVTAKLMGESAHSKPGARFSRPVAVHKTVKPVPWIVEAKSARMPLAAPPQANKKRSLDWLWAAGLAVVAMAAVSYGVTARKGNSPQVSVATATTPPTLTATVDSAATLQVYQSSMTAEAKDAWIHGFAEPILALVSSQRADFEDDFSNSKLSYSRWGFFNGVEIKNGQAIITAGDYWRGMGLTAAGRDFVITFSAALNSFSSKKPLLSFSFGADMNLQKYNHFNMGLEDGWCEFDQDGMGIQKTILSQCNIQIPASGQTIKLTIIVQGDQAAAYINDQPLLNAKGILHAGNGMSIGASVPEGIASVAIQDVKIWYLK